MGMITMKGMKIMKERAKPFFMPFMPFMVKIPSLHASCFRSRICVMDGAEQKLPGWRARLLAGRLVSPTRVEGSPSPETV